MNNLHYLCTAGAPAMPTNGGTAPRRPTYLRRNAMKLTPYLRKCAVGTALLSALACTGTPLTTFHTSAADSLTLPLPSLPPTLREPQARAAYLLQHFWDGMDFRDDTRSHNRDFMEQHFVDFLSLLPHADPAAPDPAIAHLLQRAEADPTAWRLVAELAEKYLYERESPLYSESHYRLFLERMTRSAQADESTRAHYAYQLRMVLKNAPGTTAADFAYIDREGRRRSLRRTKGNRLLLLFYDPDCEHCQETMRALQTNRQVAEAVSGKRLTVLAVYAEGDRDRWETAKNLLPREWINGLDVEQVLEHELYGLSELPALYLLDKHKKVLLKEPDTQTLTDYLSTDARPERP